jgi:hypothetical protein
MAPGCSGTVPVSINERTSRNCVPTASAGISAAARRTRVSVTIKATPDADRVYFGTAVVRARWHPHSLVAGLVRWPEHREERAQRQQPDSDLSVQQRKDLQWHTPGDQHAVDCPVPERQASLGHQQVQRLDAGQSGEGEQPCAEHRTARARRAERERLSGQLLDASDRRVRANRELQIVLEDPTQRPQLDRAAERGQAEERGLGDIGQGKGEVDLPRGQQPEVRNAGLGGHRDRTDTRIGSP